METVDAREVQGERAHQVRAHQINTELKTVLVKEETGGIHHLVAFFRPGLGKETLGAVSGRAKNFNVGAIGSIEADQFVIANAVENSEIVHEP